MLSNYVTGVHGLECVSYHGGTFLGSSASSVANVYTYRLFLVLGCTRSSERHLEDYIIKQLSEVEISLLLLGYSFLL